jgi:fructokinase
MGQVTLDVHAWQPPPYPLCAGGTVVNVLAWLAHAGWRTELIARLGCDPAGDVVVADLIGLGVNTQGIQRETTLATAVTVQEKIGLEPRFSSCCPRCGTALADVADPGSPEMVPPTPTVFFFDRDSPTALQLATRYRAAGSLIVYEPNYVGPEVPLAACLALTEVLRCSAATVPGLAEAASEVPVVIETLGAQGLRWRERGRAWQHVPAWPVESLSDTTGCGDALTAALLQAWHDGADWPTALELAVAAAARSAQYEGARGALRSAPCRGEPSLFCGTCRAAEILTLFANRDCG